jgi:hypothetical protein
VAYLSGVDLIDLALIHEQNFKNVTRCHSVGSNHCYDFTILYRHLAQTL